MKEIIFLLALFIVPGALAANLESSGLSKIYTLTSFSSYGNGDVAVRLDSNGEVCTNGYYINKSDVGFDANLSMLLSAYHAGSSVIVRGHTDQLWSGSASAYCKLYSIEFR